MTDTTVAHIGENSPEQVAYKLLQLIGNAENKNLNTHAIEANREWILKTYATCLGVVKQPHRINEWLKATG
jgi:hypothetical protein